MLTLLHGKTSKFLENGDALVTGPQIRQGVGERYGHPKMFSFAPCLCGKRPRDIHPSSYSKVW